MSNDAKPPMPPLQVVTVDANGERHLVALTSEQAALVRRAWELVQAYAADQT